MKHPSPRKTATGDAATPGARRTYIPIIASRISAPGQSKPQANPELEMQVGDLVDPNTEKYNVGRQVFVKFGKSPESEVRTGGCSSTQTNFNSPHKGKDP